MQAMLIARGHGYETGNRGRCTAFDGFEIIASPLCGNSPAERARRTLGRIDGRDGCDYGAYEVRIGTRAHDRDLYLLMHHGGGREVWRLPFVSDGGALRAHILAMPEAVQFAFLMMIYKAASESYREAADTTRREWAQAYAEGRLKKSRANRFQGARVEIIPRAAPAVA